MGSMSHAGNRIRIQDLSLSLSLGQSSLPQDTHRRVLGILFREPQSLPDRALQRLTFEWESFSNSPSVWVWDVPQKLCRISARFRQSCSL
jgi:hypothetical protein